MTSSNQKKIRREEILRAWGGDEPLPGSFLASEEPAGQLPSATTAEVRIASKLVGAKDLPLTSLPRIQKVAGQLAVIRESYSAPVAAAPSGRARKHGG